MTGSAVVGNLRICGDCDEVYPVTVEHRAPDYCRSCVRMHRRQCAQCRQQFDRDGLHVVCPSCRVQEPLPLLDVPSPRPASA